MDPGKKGVHMVERVLPGVMPKQARGWARSLIACLVVGAAIAWSTSILAMTRFYGSEGTLLRFTNIGVPNPMITPCFWGAVAFLVALGSAAFLYSRIGHANPVGGYRTLSWFLVACVLFGWGNVGYEWWSLNQSETGSIIGCTAGPMTSIFQSPCVYGSVMFLASLAATYVVVRKAGTL